MKSAHHHKPQTKIKKIKLNATILSIIKDYEEIVIKPYVRMIYDNFIGCNEMEASLVFLQRLSLVDCDAFEAGVNKLLKPTSDTACALIYLNKMLRSKDINLLKTNTEVYRDVLEGKICAKPINNQEAMNVVHTIQTMLIESYNNQVNEIAKEHAKLIGSTTFNQE